MIRRILWAVGLMMLLGAVFIVGLKTGGSAGVVNECISQLHTATDNSDRAISSAQELDEGLKKAVADYTIASHGLRDCLGNLKFWQDLSGAYIDQVKRQCLCPWMKK